MKATPLLALFALAVCGCGQSVDTAPPPSSMNPKAAAAENPPAPSTPEAKIEAIEKSDAPPDQKKAAIARVKAGQL